MFADIVVFDPATVEAEQARGHARPAGAEQAPHRRIRSACAGSSSTASETVRDGQPTGATPGTVLRSGRDTDTVATR